METIQYYTSTEFDRAPHLREEEGEVSAVKTVYLWRGKFFTDARGNPFISPSMEASLFSDRVFFLGCDDHREILCTDLSHLEEEALQSLSGTGSFSDLRKIVHQLNREYAAILAYAKGTGGMECQQCLLRDMRQ